MRALSPPRRAASAPRFPVSEPHPDKVPYFVDAQRKPKRHGTQKTPEALRPDILALGGSPPQAGAAQKKSDVASKWWEASDIFKNLQPRRRASVLQESIQAVHGRGNGSKGNGRFVREMLEM